MIIGIFRDLIESNRGCLAGCSRYILWIYREGEELGIIGPIAKAKRRLRRAARQSARIFQAPEADPSSGGVKTAASLFGL
jgi:hypothetical protein